MPSPSEWQRLSAMPTSQANVMTEERSPKGTRVRTRPESTAVQASVGFRLQATGIIKRS